MSIVTEINKLTDFTALLAENPGTIIVKLGATWCGPCQKVAVQVHGSMHHIIKAYGDRVICCDLDIDESFELYAFLKSKKMVNGIPAILCWNAGNLSFIPDDSIHGADVNGISMFFNRCSNRLSMFKQGTQGTQGTYGSLQPSL